MTQLASDNFNRADGGLGTNYTNVLGTTFGVTGSKAVVSALGPDAMVFYNAVAAPNDQYSEVTLGSPTSSAANHGYGPCVRCSAGTNGVRLVAGGAGYALDKYVGGVHTDISTPLATTTFVAGDRVRLTFTGTILSMTRNDTAFGTTYAETSLTSGGYGFGFSGTDGAGGSILLWAGGNLLSVIAKIRKTLVAIGARIGARQQRSS